MRPLCRAVYDHLNDPDMPAPWALELAFLCLDVTTGRFVRMPFEGGVMDQDSFVISAIQHAWKVWYVNEFKLANKLKYDEGDEKFMTWLLEYE